MVSHWSSSQPSFARRPAPHNAGAGGEKRARTRGCNAPQRRGLACDQAAHPQPYGGREGTPDHRRFANGKPVKERQARDCLCAQPASAAPLVIQPRPRGTGCRQGVVMRDAVHLRKMASESTRDGDRLSVQHGRCWTAIQPHRLVQEGLGGRTVPPISMRSASKGFAIGWGFPPERSHAKLGTAGGEFA